jgi:hypothetical protein
MNSEEQVEQIDHSDQNVAFIADDEHQVNADESGLANGDAGVNNQNNNEAIAQMREELASTYIEQQRTAILNSAMLTQAPPSPHRAGSIVQKNSKTRRQFMFQKLSRAVGSTGSGPIVSKGVLQERQDKVVKKTPMNTSNMVGPQSKLKELVRTNSSVAKQQKQVSAKAYGNGSILSTLQNTYDSLRASRSAGTSGKSGLVGVSKGEVAAVAQSSNNVNNAATRSTTRVKSATSSRFALPKLSSSNK